MASVLSLAMPSDKEIADVQNVISELTADDFEAQKSGSMTKAQLADKLLSYIESSETEAARFVLIQKAFQQCMEGFEYAKAVNVYSRLKQCVKKVPGGVFADWSMPYITSAAKKGRADGLVMLIKSALSEGNVIAASEISQKVRNHRRYLTKSQSWDELNAIMQRVARYDQLQKNRRMLAKSVKKNPDDAKLRSQYGFCLAALGEWPSAIEEFSKSAGKLAEVAAWEKSYPDGGASWTKLSVGEFWWDTAETAKQLEVASACRMHAASWFQSAIDEGELTGLKKVLAEKRIAEAGESGQTVIAGGAKKSVSCDKAIVLPLGKGVQIELMPCPAGEFVMGYDVTQYHTAQSRWRAIHLPHKVKISRPFWISKYPVTREQWNKLMPEIEMTDVEKALGGLKAPVSRVSPDMVYDFCLKLHKKFRRRFPSGYALRLPTEAEWEFAYRANSTPEDLYGKPVFTSKEEGFKIGFRGVVKLGIIRKELPTADIAKMDEYSLPGCTVGMKEPNPWGIFDMCGNVHEMTYDRIPYDRPDGKKQSHALWDDCPLQYKDATDPLFWTENKRYCLIVRLNSHWAVGWGGEKIAHRGIGDYPATGFRVVIAPDLLKERGLKPGER
jgi:formylglycine-generating enzyme required for sulfatase activity